MPLRNYLLGVLLGKVAFRSMFFALLSLVVILILAYLTNPSETSFRTYLTEQSFRQHLSRLDESTEDEHNNLVDPGPRLPPSRRGSNPNDGFSPFHFANRASISLRTPKHVFHSFGIFTIAAMVPLAKPNNTSSARSIYRDGSMITDSWFIGAFGKWWRGGIIEAWYHDIVARSKDEESWNSGILTMKALDKYNDYHNGLPFTTKNTLLSPAARISPPRLKNRERSSQRLGALPARSSTPPPLPKSASLPFHATRLPNTTPDHRVVSQTTLSLPATPDHAGQDAPTPSQLSCILFDQSPLIAEVLRQISSSNSTIHDLREQLADFQTTASESHALLQSEVDSYRDRKRQEDASRLELKSRTKTLEDSKRSAESTKLKAERKLKAAQNTSGDADRRVDFLDQQISELHRVLADGEAAALRGKEDVSKVEQNLLADLECKKQEIKDAEELVATLNARARELEDKLTREREKLQLARDKADIRKQDQSFFPLYPDHERTAVPPIAVNHLDAPFHDHADAFISPDHNLNGTSQESSISPGLTKLSLAGISNFNSVPSEKAQLALRAKGYSIFDDDIASLTQSQHGTPFSPFGEDSRGLDHNTSAGMLSMPLSSPNSGIIGSHNGTEQLALNFHLDNDPFMDKDRRGVLLLPQPGSTSPLTTSPVSVQDSSTDYDPFEVRFPPLASLPPSQDRLRTAIGTNPVEPQLQPFMDRQRFTVLHRTHSDPPHPTEFETSTATVEAVEANKTGGAPPRRWFSARERPRKGLNPDAKVFSLTRKAMSIPIGSVSSAIPSPLANGGVNDDGNSSGDGNGNGHVPFDALNPNGVSAKPVVSSASRAYLHAFAPSPAEREALQRALGGSSNASLDRLPSLSDVGTISIPSSPSLVSGQLQLPPPVTPAVSSTTGVNTVGGAGPEMASGRGLPSWLQALPRIRKPNFSPWDDDEVVVDPVAGSVSSRRKH